MQKQVLDTPFRDSFADYLVKGETIMWKGQPSWKTGHQYDATPDNYGNHIQVTIWSLLIIVVTAMILNGTSPLIIICVIITFIILKVLPYLLLLKKRNFKYAITQKQIFVEFKKNLIGRKEIHAIPLSEIKNVILVMTYDLNKIETGYREANQPIPELYLKEGIEKIGTIFIVPHDPQLINFDTTDLQNNEKRHLPTLELLDDAETVAKMIREGIKNANTSI